MYNCASGEEWVLGWDTGKYPQAMLRASSDGNSLWWWTIGKHVKIEDPGWQTDSAT